MPLESGLWSVRSPVALHRRNDAKNRMTAKSYICPSLPLSEIGIGVPNGGGKLEADKLHTYRESIRLFPGLVNFVPAVAYLFCLN